MPHGAGVCRARVPDSGKPGYVIMAPSYVGYSAGVACLYRLCHELNARGYCSHIAGSISAPPGLTTPLIGWAEAKRLCRQGYAAVYPETIAGNPLNARRVARWVLNRPGLLGGDKVYDRSEWVFSYSAVFTPYISGPVAGKLYMPTIDESIFYCDEWDLSKRSLECCYVGKSQWKDGIIDRDNVFEITRDAPAKRLLGNLFRGSRILYCFDNSTILIYEAMLCGCPVVIIPDGTQTREDYQQLELGMDGIAWGIEERDRADANVVQLRERCRQVKQEFEKQLERFIEITQERSAPAAVLPIAAAAPAERRLRASA